MKKDKFIELKEVSKYYLNSNTPLHVLNSINLDIFKEEFISVLGPNGCGKTTLLNLIAGFLKPSNGELYFNQTPIIEPTVEKILLAQELGLFDWKTVKDNIRFPLICQNLSKEIIKERIREAINDVGLNGFENAYPHQLSGGMKQKVAIARALVNNPDVLLLDEPLAALDLQTREFLQEELHALQHKYGKTIVQVTHNIDEAIFLSDRIVVMSSRPSKIKQIYQVNLRQPRDSSLRQSQEFLDLKKNIWASLREEAIKNRLGGN